MLQILLFGLGLFAMWVKLMWARAEDHVNLNLVTDRVRRADNNCSIVSWSGYIWIWSGARDQESTNHNARFAEWKSRYITMYYNHLSTKQIIAIRQS